MKIKAIGGMLWRRFLQLEMMHDERKIKRRGRDPLNRPWFFPKGTGSSLGTTRYWPGPNEAWPKIINEFKKIKAEIRLLH